MKTYKIGIDGSGVDELIDAVTKFRDELPKNLLRVCDNLTNEGIIAAHVAYSGADYADGKDYFVDREDLENGYLVKAGGDSVLFLEFGSGVRYGYGHPENAEFGMGPGTWSDGPEGKGHWDDPNGWTTPGGNHTYGNAPAMGMYNARKVIEQNAEHAIHEVFDNAGY